MLLSPPHPALQRMQLWGLSRLGWSIFLYPLALIAVQGLKLKGYTPRGPEADITRMTLASKAWGPSLQTD